MWYNRVRHRLDAIGMTQAQLANLIGAKQPRLSMWLSGQRDPSMAYFAAIVQAVGVDANWVLTGKTIESSNDDPWQLATGIADSL